jgi:RNA polymerase sigma-70 factor (ECF subfamily)
MAFRIDVADFSTFYERTYDGCYRTALGIVRDPALAADITQDAYVAAYQKRDDFRGDAPGFAWLHTIVVNHALAAIRRKRPTVTEVEVADISRGPDHARATSDRVSLFAALETLNPRQRAAVVLRYYHDYDYATIARIMGTSSTNVGALLSRALDQLRATLEPSQAAGTATAVAR